MPDAFDSAKRFLKSAIKDADKFLDSAIKDASDFVEAAVEDADKAATSTVDRISRRVDAWNAERTAAAERKRLEREAEEQERQRSEAEEQRRREAEQLERQRLEADAQRYRDAAEWEQERREAEEQSKAGESDEVRRVAERIARESLSQEQQNDGQRAHSGKAPVRITDEELQAWIDHDRATEETNRISFPPRSAPTEISLEDVAVHDGFDDLWGEAQQRLIDAFEVSRAWAPWLSVCPCCDCRDISDDDFIAVHGRNARSVCVCANCFLDANTGDRSFWHWYWHLA